MQSDNYKFLIPLYNDWPSLNILLNKINRELRRKKKIAEIFIVNDFSTDKKNILKKKLTNIKKIKILNLKSNVGSQKAIFTGLQYLKQFKNNSIITIMDSDGEDDPSKLLSLIKKAEDNQDSIIFAKRTKRLEPLIFRFLNFIRLLITFILTGKYMSIGNYSSFSSKNLLKILSNNKIELAYCSGVLKNCKKIDFLGVKKKKRYFGFSKVKFSFLIMHSLKIISVFLNQVLIRSAIIISTIILLFQRYEIYNYIIYILLLFNLFCVYLNIINLYFIRSIKIKKVDTL